MSIVVQAAALAGAKVVQWRQEQQARTAGGGSPRRGRRRVRAIGAHQRSRNQVKDIYRQLGPTNFKKAYRMKYHSFKRLAQKLRNGIIKFSLANKRRNGSPRTSTNETNYRYVPNGPITPSVRLACALRYFAGGSPYDLMTSYCIGHTDMVYSIWYVVDAINAHAEFQISYPTDHGKQRAIAESFRRKSGASFECCAGAIDGILVWIHKPTEEECAMAGCSSGKFFCGRKHKFGLNCQAVCDSRGKFLEVSIIYPGSTSDCLAFEGMSLFTRLEDGLLAPGLCLFGDNAYLNSMYMATPFAGGVSGGSKDAYNFYHSQLRINIECAFGMFTHRWAILRKAIPMRVSLKKAIALVVALAKLHNFCIDENEARVPPSGAVDELRTEMQGGVPLEPTTTTAGTQVILPRQLIDGGLHFDDIDRQSRRRRVRQYQSQAAALHQQLPRDFLHDSVAEANLTRPPVPTRRAR
jgi:DDE superfamily endonuclease